MTSKEIQILSNYAAKERARIQLEIESTLKKGCDIANANKLMQLCDSRFFVGQMTELLKSLTPDDRPQCPKAVFQPSLSPETIEIIRDELACRKEIAESTFRQFNPFFRDEDAKESAKAHVNSFRRALDEFNAVYPEEK